MNNCVDIGTIQGFLDGELAPAASEAFAHHIGSCDGCATQLATAEEESSFAFAALENEFNVPVPTHRLWTKINDKLAAERPTFWQSIWANFTFSNPSILAFASLLVVFGTFAIFWSLNQKQISDSPTFTKVEPKKIESSSTPEFIDPVVNPTKTPNAIAPRVVKKSTNEPKKFTAMNVAFVAPKTEKRKSLNVSPENKILSAPQLVNGEDTYIKTIATLSQSVDSTKDTVLRPSARIDLERNLAMVDNAITTMQKKARKNPKDEGAKQILFSSYQTKIDLLSSVNEKSELIASIR
jgi:hypothetical protein